MAVDNARHHRLARQVDARPARRRLQLSTPADLREAPVLNDEGSVLDGCATIAGDQTRSFEERRDRRRLRQLRIEPIDETLRRRYLERLDRGDEDWLSGAGAGAEQPTRRARRLESIGATRIGRLLDGVLAVCPSKGTDPSGWTGQALSAQPRSPRPRLRRTLVCAKRRPHHPVRIRNEITRGIVVVVLMLHADPCVSTPHRPARATESGGLGRLARRVRGRSV